MWDQDKLDGYNSWLDSDSNLSIYQDNKIEVQTHYLEYKNLNSKPRLEDLSNIDLLLDADGDDLPVERIEEKNILHTVVMICAQQMCNEANAMLPQPQETHQSGNHTAWR